MFDGWIDPWTSPRPCTAADFERLFQQQGRDFERFYAEAARIGALPKAQRHATLRAIP